MYDMEKQYGERIIARMDLDQANYLRSKDNVSEYLRGLVDQDMRQKRLPTPHPKRGRPKKGRK